MADTFDSRLKLRLQESGANSGQWGTLLNQTVTNIASVFGFGTHQLTSDADATLTLSDDGASIDVLKSSYLKITSSVSLTATRTLTFAPNTLNQVKYIENATSGSQSITISQGSGANVTIESGATKVVYFDGAGSGAAVVDALANIDQGTAEFDTIRVSTIKANDGTASSTIADSTGVMTIASAVLTTADINGGTIDNTVIGGSTPAAGSFTTVTATNAADFGVVLGTGTAGDGLLKIGHFSNGTFIGTYDDDGGAADSIRFGTHSGDTRLTVNSTGIDVTGSVTADGLTSSTSIQTTGSSSYFISNSSSSGDYIRLYAGSGTGKWDIYGNGANLRIGDNDSAGSVVIDTNLGIGTTSPATKLNLRSDTSDDGFLLEKSDGTDIARLFFDGTSTNARFDMFSSGSATVQIRANGDTHFSGGNFGIGTNSPDTLLDIEYTAANHTGGIHISNKQTGGYGNRICFNSTRSDNNSLEIAATIRTEGNESWDADNTTSSNLIFQTIHDNSLAERMRIQSGGGISFNGDTAAANALDDYEEGIFTPVLNFSDTTGITYGQQTGTYTKIGNIVCVNIIIVLSNKGTSTGTATITGLPFSTGFSNFAFLMYSDRVTTTGGVVAGYIPSGTGITLYEQVSGQNNSLSNSAFVNNSYLSATFTYRAA